MASQNIEDPEVYVVLVNNQGQRSLWPKWKPAPVGWNGTGFEGSKEACVAEVDRTWTDLRSVSQRT